MIQASRAYLRMLHAPSSNPCASKLIFLRRCLHPVLFYRHIGELVYVFTMVNSECEASRQFIFNRSDRVASIVANCFVYCKLRGSLVGHHGITPLLLLAFDNR